MGKYSRGQFNYNIHFQGAIHYGLTLFQLNTDTMGKYSRGQFNYNIHFQGAIHYGLTLFQLRAISNPVITGNSLYLYFPNSDCLEQLGSLLISNDHELPPIQVREWNPLIYTSIDDKTLKTTPKVQFYSMVNHSSDAQAAAVILINRLMIELNTSEWGMTEVSHTRLSRLSIQDILQNGE
ncbi:hypothetical protein QE152_g39862 [Popillia japonica]|uniref:Uncharacterized protein n=1 Tax=Popillia japonica TaxID=7064 RepID=A0AAW1HT62_POPJA